MRFCILTIGLVVASAVCQEDEIVLKTFSLGQRYSLDSKSVRDTDYGIREKLRRTIPGNSFPGISQRNVLNLFTMLKCSKDSCPPTSYLDYGCYCGLTISESGYTVDEIDTCCQQHDRCYDESKCRFLTEYWFPYSGKCSSGSEPRCDSDQGFFAWLFGVESCMKKICECDRALAKCLRRYPCPATKAECEPPLDPVYTGDYRSDEVGSKYSIEDNLNYENSGSGDQGAEEYDAEGAVNENVHLEESKMENEIIEF